VASVPVTMPAMFTMTAALGSRALGQSGILVTRLSAVQDAAAMDVLCLDKTGTITENRLNVEQLAPARTVTADELLLLAALASEEATQDPLDLAILLAASERALTDGLPPRQRFVPFDPASKRSEAIVSENGRGGCASSRAHRRSSPSWQPPGRSLPARSSGSPRTAPVCSRSRAAATPNWSSPAWSRSPTRPARTPPS
jgi:magnesium-transporting ATPase (P-type)